VLDFLGDDVLAGGPLHSAADVGSQEVVDRPLSAPHASANRLLLDVLSECRPLLGVRRQ
jgi:hypothetical protein